MLILYLIRGISSLCLPGSSECEGDTMKMCDLNGEWVIINCPSSSKCVLDNNKITCLPNKERENRPDEAKNDKVLKSQPDKEQKGEEKKEDKKNGERPNMENKPEENKKPESQGNDNAKTSENTQKPSSNGSQPENGNAQEASSKKPEEKTKPENPQETNSKKPEEKPQPGNSQDENTNKPEEKAQESGSSKPEEKPQPGNAQESNQSKPEENGSSENQQKPSEPKNESVKPVEEKIITLYKTVTVREMIEKESEQPIEQEVSKSVKKPNLPCCDEELQTSCRICRDYQPIRAIVIDRESLLGTGSNNTEQAPTNNEKQEGSAKKTDQSAQEDLSAFSGNSHIPVSNSNAESTPQQSSGPPKTPNNKKGSAPSDSKFLKSTNSKNSSTSNTTKNSQIKSINKDSGKVDMKPSESLKSSNTGTKVGASTGHTKPKGALKSSPAGAGSGGGSGGGSSGGSSGSSGGSGGFGTGEKITSEDVKKVTSELEYNPSEENVNAISQELGSSFSDRNEASMFLAQIIHESAGLTKTSEQGCEQNAEKCSKNYDDGQGKPGKSYYGRGFMQLSWAANYKEAGEGIGMGDKLLDNPDLVSKDPKIAAKTAVWYWKTRVATAPGVKENKFGATTKAINGSLECNGQNVEKSKKRYEIYMKIVKTLDISNPASEGGCY